MKNTTIAKLLGLGALACATQASAGWTPQQLPQLITNFETAVANKYSYTAYSWQFFTLADCYQPGVKCPFPNPDGPYGQPVINGTYASADQMGPTDAWVVIMETPPTMLYFGITPYLYTRYYSQIPGQPTGTSGVREVLESINDSFDMDDMLTTGSTKPGVNSFSQLSAIIMTADQTTYNQLSQAFTAAHFPAFNLFDMPYKLVPLKMGTGSGQYDSYSMLMRLAYPSNDTAMQTYVSNPPITLLHLVPKTARTIQPLASPSYKVPGDSTAESSQLKSALATLSSQLVTQYGSSYSVAQQTISLSQTNNYVCISDAIDCDDDNSDALYTHDDNNWVPTTLQDKLLIVGVNHVDTGKATYISHSVLNMTHQAGVESVNQDWLAGSALKMAGITSTSDPRYATYSQLYAFTMSYDCTGEAVCLTIPQPTSTNPIGVTFGDTIGESARIYVDPKTLTRPSSSQIIFQNVYVLTKN